MFGLSDAYKYYVCTQPVKGNAGEDTLLRHVIAASGMTPTSGDAFVIFSNDRKKMSILRWDGESLIIINKCLAHNTFRPPKNDADISCFELSYDDLFTLVRRNRIEQPRALQRAKRRSKKLY